MKRFLLLLLSLLVYNFSYSQDQLNRAFYIYRNDGIFNAFYYSEVDSITYSCIDADDIEQVNPVTQEIWTSDSVYRIPLNVIDSISFVKPETSYKENVIRLDEKYIPYIISSDSLSIKFGQDLPQSLMPKKNDILLFEGFSDLFPDGFVGRVNSISNNFIVECDSAEFEEVYDELVLLGDYVLTEDNQNTRAYKLVSSRIAGEVPLAITLPLSHSFGPISIKGSITQGIRLRIVARLQRGMPPYVEMQVKDVELGNVNITASAKTSSFRQVGDKLFGISVPIPGCPALRFDFATSPFVKPELKSETSFGYEWSSKGQTSYVYDGNSWQTIQMPRVCKQNITAKTGFNGSLWYGVVESVHIATIKNFISVGADIYIGPKISGNVDINIGDGISSTNIYETLKDTKMDLSLRFESDIAFRWRLNKNNAGYTPLANIVPGIEWYIGERYLFPLFTKPEYNVSKAIVDVSSEVSRSLLLPCTVGFRLSNSGETIDTHYNDRTYWDDDDFSSPLTTSFTGLKHTTGKYEVCPMVRILGWEVEATPVSEFNYGLNAITGGASASFTEARCWGGVLVNDDSNTDVAAIIDECGFFYNLKGMPQNGNATRATCDMGSDGLFEGTLFGLTEDTQYYYTAFVRVGEDYYYGETSSFRTKKKEDPYPDHDPIPDPDSIPIAITERHYDETATTAMIECTYENIPAGADCGYYLHGYKGGTIIGSISRSFGNVEGTKTAHLTDLKPAATYYYQAYAQYKDKEYLGTEKSFQTSTPNAVTGEYSDVTSNKATIICGYYDVPPGATTGVKLYYNGQTDELPYSYGEGEHKIDVNNLYPSTSYTYSAYIKFENDYYEGSSKQFKTLTPSAYVGEATEIEEEKAQFGYGFSNVPSGGSCHIVLQQEGGETYEYSVSDVEQDVFQLSGLQPSTTYTYWSYVEYYGETWNSNTGSFTTLAPPVPSAITGNASDITDKSAYVECTFSNVPERGVCGVEITWNGGSTKQACGSSDGTKTISLGGLKPNTTYTYCAYVEANDTTYYGETKSFTTKDEELPDLSGWWTFNQTYLGAKSVTMNLVLDEQGSDWASYKASGFYGVITFNMTVHSNRNVSLSLNALNGAHGAFSGTFDEGFTSVSGDSYLYVPDNNNWAVAPWTVNDSWTFSR